MQIGNSKVFANQYTLLFRKERMPLSATCGDSAPKGSAKFAAAITKKDKYH